jgi:hypothetical protein
LPYRSTCRTLWFLGQKWKKTPSCLKKRERKLSQKDKSNKNVTYGCVQIRNIWGKNSCSTFVIIW